MTLGWPTRPPRLSDGHIVLRGWAATDAEAVHRACQDPEIQRWTTVPAPYEPHHASGFVGELAAELWASGRGAPFCISDSEDRLLGACGLVAVDHDRLTAEVGYWTAPDTRSRGASRRAVILLADWAFECGLRRLELLIEPGNLGSITVAERAGCSREGLLRSKAVVRGERRDMLIYALVN